MQVKNNLEVWADR